MSVSTPVLVGSLAESVNTNSAHVVPVSHAASTGSFVLVTIVESNATHTFTCADSQGNTWTGLTRASSNNTQPCSSQFFYSVLTNGLTTSDTITVTGNSTANAAVWAVTMTGVNTSSPIDVDGTASNTSGQSAAWASTSISPSVGSLMYVAGGIGVASATYSSLTSGFTQDQKVSSSGTGGRTGLGVYQAITATGSKSAAATLGTSANSWSAMAVSIAPAAAPAGGSGVSLISTSGVLKPVVITPL